MADGTNSRQKPDNSSVAAQSLIRKLTTEKAVKAYRQQTKEVSASEDDITNIKLASRGIKTIESLDLPSLRRLDLSKNNLNRLKGLQGCPQVTYLTVAGNELTGDGLDGVRPLKDLKVFNASGNRVRRIAPAVFAQFRNLQALVLNDNEITEVPPTWLKKGLLSLNTLVLSHNKVKSLSETGLGRLTMITKLSVSYNTLVELPDLSACIVLEELRAAHNLISQVPASLSKNTALRTLDLGHNRIDSWIGLERLGKSLHSVMQLSLAGNPLCGNTVAVVAAERETGEDGGGEEEGGYVAKVRSLFPGLKVRDGKRVLMKKSHTYYEQRRGDEGGGEGVVMDGTQAGPGGRRAPGNGSISRTEKRKGDGGGAEKVGRRGQGARGSSVNTDVEEETAGGEGMSKAERKLKRKAAREAAAEATVEAKTEEAALTKPDKTKKKRRRREEEEEEERLGSAVEVAAAAAIPSAGAGDVSKEQLHHGFEKEEAVVQASAAAVVATASSAEKPKALKRKKTAKPDVTVTPSGGGGSAQHQEDPYSSSEELPIPIPGKQARHGDGNGKVVEEEPRTTGATVAAAVPSGGDRASGVVSVVINKKRKGAKGAQARRGGAAGAAAASASGDGGRQSGFSVDAMLEARGQKETIGLGSGVSAWD